ncbi:MAG TPA: PPE domain-containing protein, partial [Mycobacterium sp.]|nr:PPE domain-containing protein [Mycobacterium sp.]
AEAAYQSVINGLISEGWMGPASNAMAAAAAPYAAWMGTTATQAEQAAAQARAAAAAYEAALAATVPPQVVTTNRTQLQSLVASNVMGQNTPAIAVTETQYGEMWAQDAAAMYGYAGSSASAAKVTPFTQPAETTNPAGLAGQAAAVTQAAGTAAGTHSQTSDLLTATPHALQGLASPASSSSSSTSSTGSSSPLSGLLSAWSTYAGPIYNTTGLPYFGVGMANSLQSIIKSLMPAAKAAADGASAAAGAASLPSLGGLLSGLGGGGGAVSASFGQAASAGGLSVPSGWAAAPAMHPGAAVPVSTVSAVTPDPGAGNLLGGMPLAGAGMGAHGGATPRYGFRPTIMVRSPIAG